MVQKIKERRIQIGTSLMAFMFSKEKKKRKENGFIALVQIVEPYTLASNSLSTIGKHGIRKGTKKGKKT